MNIIPLYMFRTPLCPSSGSSQLHMQSLVPINYKNTCCLQICRYVHFIVTADYLCGKDRHPQTHEKAAVTTQQDWRTQRTKHQTVRNQQYNTGNKSHRATT